MPDFRFYHPLEVRYADLDPQGHVNNAKFLTYFEQARIAYLIHLGLFDADQSFMEIGVILADVHVTFLAPVFFGADLRVGVCTTHLGHKSMQVAYRLVDGGDGRELARGESVLVTYDYHSRQAIPIPQAWRKRIAEFEG